MTNKHGKRTTFITLSKINLLVKKLAILTLAFSFVLQPVYAVLADETVDPAPVDTVSPADTTTTPPDTSTVDPAPADVTTPENIQPDTSTVQDEPLPPVDDTTDGKDTTDETKKPDALLNALTTPMVTALSVSNTRLSLTPDVDNTNGALTYKYAINTPPGRNGLTPDVAIVYNSANATSDSIIGAGWSINIPYIDRINKKGTTTLFSDNYYSSSLSGELVALNSTDYAAKVEKGDFLKYTKQTNGWLVTDKNGTKYTFGLNAQARADDPSGTKVFKWMLEEVRDTNDNYISYTYYKDAGQIYPAQIVHTGNGSTPGIFKMNFDRVSRTGAPVLYNTGFSVKSNYRISEIRTEVSGVWARKYALAYTIGDNASGSLLDTIIESGQSDTGAITTLPAVDFDYQGSVKSWSYTPSWSHIPIPFTDSNIDTGVRLADINGDGLFDILCHNYGTSGYCPQSMPRVYLNNGDGTWTDVSSTWLFPSNTYFLNITSMKDTGLRILDINGDGLADLVRADGTGSSYVYLNTGSGWTYSSIWSHIPIPFYSLDNNVDTGVRMADINGDGLPDLLCHTANTTGLNYCSQTFPAVYLNNGDGNWTDVSSTWLFPFANGGTTGYRESFLTAPGKFDTGLRTMDINNDGLADLVMAGDSNYVYLNNGSGWTYTPTWNNIPVPFTYSNADTSARIIDINSDGLLDVICHNDFTSGGYCGRLNPQVHLNKGDGTWTDVSSTWLFPPVSGGGGSYGESFLTAVGGADRGLRAIDINGDGITDLVMAGDSSANYVYLNGGNTQANLLKKITYPQGGNTAISYKATPQFRNGSTLLNATLPMTLDVVSQIVTNDGSGTAESLTYEYEGGRYYYNTYLDRKFAGFNSIKVTDAAGNVKKTYYYQGNSTNTALGEYDDHVSKIGIPYRIEEYDGSNNLYRLTVDKVDKYNIGTNHDFVKVIRRTGLDFDGNSGHRDTAVEYAYDNTNGNTLSKTEWGEVTGNTDGSFTDTGSDKRVTAYTYATNGTTLVNALSSEAVANISAVKVRENKYYYDAQAYGGVTKGNQTKVEQWVSGSTYVNNQKTYNTNGTVATSTDPRGKVTTYTAYDSYNLYPTTITDPLSYAVQYTYDYSLGKPKQITEQNGFVYQTVYDGLDRATAVKIPDLVSPYSPVTKTSYTYTDTSGAVKAQKTDYLDATNTVDTYQYFDGLGRLIQERKEAEIAGNFNVKDIVYNNVGLVQKQSLPYTGSGSLKTAATSTTSLYATNTYDPLQRISTMTDATGTTSYAYDDWKTTVTDKNGKVKKYSKDAYDNLAKVEEVNGASTYTTNYEWNLNGKLTKITDALGNIRNFTYDGLGRRLTAEDLHATGDSTFGAWTYAYDDAGNLIQTISPNALTTNYTYNNINQVLTEDYTGGAGTEVSYTYSGCTSGIEKLCSVTMTSGANTTYTYDSNGNTANETKTINSTAYTTSYTYDRQGNKLTITYPDLAQAKYTFNTAGLLEKIERKESGGAFTDVISNFDYSPADQITTQTYPNTVTTTNTYDATKLYRLTRRLTQNSALSKLQDLNYTYDNNGNITRIIDASNTASSKTANYTYDDLNRLTSATITAVASGQSPYTYNYTYDALGNILTGPNGSYLYQGTLKSNPHAATSINGVTYTYDSDGNLTGNGTLSNTWNYKDQLTQAVVGAVTSTYTYDHTGERATTNNGTTTTVYPNDSYNTNGTKKTKSIYAGGQLIATIETVSGVVTPYYNHTDQLNSITSVSNNTGALTETLDYYPYGNQRISAGTYTNQRQYIGEMYDTNTGLDYLNARYYKGDVGRFISEDSMFWNFDKAWLADPQNQNSYAYARNNPIGLSDPSGLLTIIIPGTGYSKKDWSPSGTAGKFISDVGKTFNETPQILNWSGRDNSYARQQAADNAIDMINSHNFAEGEKLNIVGHSHGGNIGILISQETSRKIDNLVTLGTPAESDYQPNYSMIGSHINAYNTSDGVQPIGGNQLKLSGVIGGFISGLTCGPACAINGYIMGSALGWGEVGPAGRTFSGAQNIPFSGGGSLIGAHSSYWNNPIVWSTISKQVK